MNSQQDGIQLDNLPEETDETSMEHEELEGGQENQLPDPIGNDVKQKAKSGLKGFATGFKNMIPSSVSIGRQGNEETGAEVGSDEAGIEAESKATSGIKSLTAGLKNPFAGIGRRNADETTNSGTEAGESVARPAGVRRKISRMNSGMPTPQPDGDEIGDDNPIPVPTPRAKPISQQEAEQNMSNGFNNKKTLANGLMDFAFLTANANQLHYALTASRVVEDDRIISIALISTSITLQLFAGILLIAKSYIQSKPTNDLNDPLTNKIKFTARLRWLNVIDHMTIVFVFMIAIINIFIASFSITQTPDNNSNSTAIAVEYF